MAVPDGMRLSDWWTSRGVPRSTAFRLVAALGIEPLKARAPGSRSPVSYLTAAHVEAMDKVHAKHREGRTIGEIETSLAPLRKEPETSQDGPDRADDGSHAPPGPELLLARLEAAERAMRTGFPLSTAELGWIIGARPGATVVARGGLIARRHARNVWTLEPEPSLDDLGLGPEPSRDGHGPED